MALRDGGDTRRRARTRAQALLVAAAAGLGLLLTYAWAVLTPDGQYVDNRAMQVGSELLERRWAASLLELVSPATVLLAAVGLSLAAWLAHGGRAALAVAATASVTPLLAQMLKDGLSRPPLLGEVAPNSWPSGHVAVVAGLAAAAVLAVPAAARLPLGLLGLAGVALSGVATVVLHWHRPSDVLAAALLAVLVAATTVAVTGGLRAADHAQRQRPSGQRPAAGARAAAGPRSP